MQQRTPVPRDVADELKRVIERWQQLPLDHALSRMPLTADLIQRLADDVAESRGRPVVAVPSLGPGVLMDQLTVMVQDHCAAFGADSFGADSRGADSRDADSRDADGFGHAQHGTRVTDLLGELSGIRRAL